MAEDGGGRGLIASAEGGKRPSITLPARSSIESLFRVGVSAEASPGPMTLVSRFFAEDSEPECRSFSQLLAGAMASPAATRKFLAEKEDSETADARGRGEGASLNLGHNRPMSLLVAQSPYFTVPAGLSPGGFLDSPAMFCSNLGQLGMSHQQALAQVTAQATNSQAQNISQGEYSSSLSSASAINMEAALPLQPISSCTYSSESFPVVHCDQRTQPAALVVDKPVEDGYNWRKYGQKQVKGSEFPRSYYKCTHPKCPVKKKVERSFDGHVTEIIYKGQHNHQRPPANKRSKDSAAELNENSDHNNADSCLSGGLSNSNLLCEGMLGLARRDREFGHGTSEQLSGSSHGEELGDADTGINEAEYGSDPEQKRRKLETTAVEPASHRTVTEPRIIVQTTSEVDLLDDGYRWRKYGQKVVKGNPYPRSYYKCTHAGCNVRKHVERASSDPKAVITTYEGKHSHDVPAARNSSHNTGAPANRNNFSAPPDFGPNNAAIRGNLNAQRPVAILQLKAEHEMTQNT